VCEKTFGEKKMEKKNHKKMEKQKFEMTQAPSTDDPCKPSDVSESIKFPNVTTLVIEDNDLDVCSPGIHYYLTPKSAELLESKIVYNEHDNTIYIKND
jgi:hypothetical protein